MDDSVMRILQLLQDGKITAQEAETLIATLKGEAREGAETKAKPKDWDGQKRPERQREHGTPRIDLDDLGEKISRAVSRIAPERIARQLQVQLRCASQTGAHWGANVSNRVRIWTDGDDTRPANTGNHPEHAETNEFEQHLEPGAYVSVENPAGNVRITGVDSDVASVIIRKLAWGATSNEAVANGALYRVETHGTDTRLDVKVSVPEYLRRGTVDIEMRLPRASTLRATTRFGEAAVYQLNERAEIVTVSGSLTSSDMGGDVRGETVSGGLSVERIGGAAALASQSGDIHAADIRRGITASTASGDVSVARVEGGRVECKSISGDVTVADAASEAPLDISVESVSGDVNLRNGHGNITLKTVSGDANGSGLTANRIQSQTVSGDISLELVQPFSGAMQINSISGDVHAAIPEGSNARVAMNTTSGDVSCELDSHEVTATDTMWHGQIGTGAGSITIHTISGDSRIKRA